MLSTLGGLAVLAILAVDAFVTILHASSGAGPFTTVQNRVIWRLLRSLAHQGVSRRILSLAAPLMALATPAAWITLLTVGFALVYHPVVASFSAQPPLETGTWVEALYFSGYLTSTLGLGDVVPSGSLWRLSTVFHSAMGFAFFSAAITYILSIYGRYIEDAGLALDIHNLFGGEGFLAVERTDEIAREYAARLSMVNVGHRQYPILHYFHGGRSTSLTVQVGHLIDLIEAAPPASRGVGVRALEKAVDDFLDQMPFDVGGEQEDPGLRTRHRKLLQAHLYAT